MFALHLRLLPFFVAAWSFETGQYNPSPLGVQHGQSSPRSLQVPRWGHCWNFRCVFSCIIFSSVITFFCRSFYFICTVVVSLLRCPDVLSQACGWADQLCWWYDDAAWPRCYGKWCGNVVCVCKSSELCFEAQLLGQTRHGENKRISSTLLEQHRYYYSYHRYN